MPKSAEKMTAQQAWRVLGIAAHSSFEDAKATYKRLCLTRHPDKPEGSKEKFQVLKDAWDFITKNVFRKDGTRIGGGAAAAGGMAGRAAGGRAGPGRPSPPPTRPTPQPSQPKNFIAKNVSPSRRWNIGDILAFRKDGTQPTTDRPQRKRAHSESAPAPDASTSDPQQKRAKTAKVPSVEEKAAGQAARAIVKQDGAAAGGKPLSASARVKRLGEAYAILSRKAEKENKFVRPSSFQPLKQKLEISWPWDEARRAIFSKLSNGIAESNERPPDQRQAQLDRFVASLSEEEKGVMWVMFWGERERFKKGILEQGGLPPGVSLEAFIDCLSSEECGHLLMWLREPEQIPPKTLDGFGIALLAFSRQGSSAAKAPRRPNVKWAEMLVCGMQKKAVDQDEYFTTTAHLQRYHTDPIYRNGFKCEVSKQLSPAFHNKTLNKYKNSSRCLR